MPLFGTPEDELLGCAAKEETTHAEARTRAHLLDVIRNYNRPFFDHNLKGMKATLLDQNVENEFVEAVQGLDPQHGIAEGGKSRASGSSAAPSAAQGEQ